MKICYFTHALNGTANYYMNRFCNLKCYSSQFTAKNCLFKIKIVLLNAAERFKQSLE